MIKFFRRIRQNLLSENKTGKYLKYAIGEIFLVVIGILIALQINNWNEQRKARIQEHAVLRNFIQDLKADSLSFSRNFKTLTDINYLHKELYEIGVKDKNDLNIENPSFIRRLLYYNPIAKENDPFIANKISSNAIRQEIQSYLRYLKDMDDTYREFEDVIQDRIRVFLAKKDVHDLSGWFENQTIDMNEVSYQDIIKQEDLILLSKMPEFQQLLLEASIKSNETFFTLKMVIDQNEHLKNTIVRELKK